MKFNDKKLGEGGGGGELLSCLKNALQKIVKKKKTIHATH